MRATSMHLGFSIQELTNGNGELGRSYRWFRGAIQYGFARSLARTLAWMAFGLKLYDRGSASCGHAASGVSVIRARKGANFESSTLGELMRTLPELIVCLMVIGCVDETRLSLGSGTIASNGQRDYLYVVSPDQMTLARVDLGKHSVDFQVTGHEPIRIGQSDDYVYVTNRGSRSISVFEETGEHLHEVSTLDVGAEPYGIAVSGDRVYVSVSMENSVKEYVSKDLVALRTWSVDAEPRGLALHRSGGSLYAASTFEGKWTYINLTTGDAQE